MDFLVSLSPVILFSAAIPFQGGLNHLNEQWPEYWNSLFNSRGYKVIDCVRKRIWENDKISYHYRQNILLFVKKDGLENRPLLKNEIKNGNFQLSIVHPEVYLERIWSGGIWAAPKDLPLKKVIEALPLKIVNAFKAKIEKIFK